MSQQQYPPQQQHPQPQQAGRGVQQPPQHQGGRGGGGRGVGMVPNYTYAGAGGGGGGRGGGGGGVTAGIGAWQPAAPTSMQPPGPSGYTGQVQQPGMTQQQGMTRVSYGPPIPGAFYPSPYHHHPHHSQPTPPPYNHRGSTGTWQATGPPGSSPPLAPPQSVVPPHMTPYASAVAAQQHHMHMHPHHHTAPPHNIAPPHHMHHPNQNYIPPAAMRGGIYYPPPIGQQGQPSQQPTQPPVSLPVIGTPVPPAPRQKKPLIVTDKEGNVIDLSSAAPKKAASSTPAASAATVASNSDAGAKMRQIALERMSGESKKREEKELAIKDAEDKVKKEAEENLLKEADEKFQKEKEDTLKRETDEKVKRDADETTRLELVENEKTESANKAVPEEAEDQSKTVEKVREEIKARGETEEEKTQENETEKIEEDYETFEKGMHMNTAATKDQSKTAATEEVSEENRMTIEAGEEAKQDNKNRNEFEKESQVTTAITNGNASSHRLVYTKNSLLAIRETAPKDRPDSLIDMSIQRGPSRGNAGANRSNQRESANVGSVSGGSGNSGGGEWQRGSAPPRRQSSQGETISSSAGGGSGHWSRGQAPPKVQNQNQNQNRGRQRSGRGSMVTQTFYDGPVAPLVKSENHWRPKKSTDALVLAEKQVKAILNKMTKEKFEKLSEQMLAIPITSSETLNMIINNVFDKAIDEPSFGDMYADLCSRLSQCTQASSFVHIIESDEEPPTEDGAAPAGGESSSYTVYRWSNDVSTTDAEVVGPFASVEECFDAALSVVEHTPKERGELELELVSVTIKSGMFVKVMKKKVHEAEEDNIYYTVYFPVSEINECGQQLSKIFLSERECISDANKVNSFKSSLLNKCEREFEKQDIYADWKTEKNDYEQNKRSMTEAERAEKEEELSFRRIRIKKQMLGNVKFIGQLYKKNMLRASIMRFCIAKLLKLKPINETAKSTEYIDSGDTSMDEEDHEAICSIFTTIGSTIDTPTAARFMSVCFSKIKALSTDKNLPSRSRFMYKDLLELRENRWVPRRKVEKAKTLEEIRKDVEQEERHQAQLAAARPVGGRGEFLSRTSGRGDIKLQRNSLAPNRPRQSKVSTEVDEDGFMKIPAKSNSQSKTVQTRNTAVAALTPTKPSSFAVLEEDTTAASATPATESVELVSVVDEDTLKKKFKSMRSDFLADGGNVDELLLMFKSLSSNSNAGILLVSESMDRLAECKDDERAAIVKIVCALFENGMLSTLDIRKGIAEYLEFIDSLVLDAPRVFEFVGKVLSEMLRIGAIDMDWLCEQCELIKVNEPDTNAPEKIIRETFHALCDSSVSMANEVARGSNESLRRLLDEEVWKSISEKL